MIKSPDKPLKHSRQAVLDFIIRYKQQHDGNSPSMREIMAASSVSTLSLIDHILDDLVDAGLIVRGPGARNIQVVGGRWQFEVRGD